MAKAVLAGEGRLCPKCSRPMRRLAHGLNWRPKAAQPYYYAYWDHCKPCRHIQHYEAAKIWVDPKPDTGEADRLVAVKEQLGEGGDTKPPWEE